MKQKSFLLIIFLFLLAGIVPVAAQESDNAAYIAPEDPLVQKNLEEWQDLKFGFMMHWGPYSQWGIVESWSICSEDVPWCRRNAEDYTEYKKAYEMLKTTFNPGLFDPESWAKAAKEAGMKYLVFTTKHHDGFSMFDTKLTDYRITDEHCPFHKNPRADVTKYIFEAFRAEGFKVGAYFSKPDWHSPYYWWPYFATPDRHVNYDPEKYPERWEQFKQFVHSQVEELMTRYGRVDILWLDGGWVRPRPGIGRPPWNQDIDMPALAAMARSHQPGLIVVDRSVAGKYENYRTPEQRVPDKPLPYPWETCMTMGGSWSYNPLDHYKPTNKLIHLLVDIVSKGGNFLLNVGPSPQGTLPPEALQRMKEIGAWMKVNGTAIYGTRPVAPYKEENICFTKGKEDEIYAIYLAGEEEKKMPATLHIKGFRGSKGTKVQLLGRSGTLKWKNDDEGMILHIPAATAAHPPCEHAWAFRITGMKKNDNAMRR
jgi:alpha-L-fucosidase